MLAELDFEELVDDTAPVSFCHILCCHPSLTLCGAYKPILCRILTIEVEGIPEECEVCRKKICPDCVDLAFKPCPRCV